MSHPSRWCLHLGSAGLSLPTGLRRSPAILLVSALLAATLAACGGAELTTQEYAEAMETISSSADDELEATFDDFSEGDFLTLTDAELERVKSLENAESWSEEDAEVVTKFAESLVRATADFVEDVIELSEDSLDEMSALRPPEYLADLHREFVDASKEAIGLMPAQVELIRDIDTDIRNREDFDEFFAYFSSIEFDPGSGSPDPDLEAKAQEVAEQVEQACQALKDQLEEELEREVELC